MKKFIPVLLGFVIILAGCAAGTPADIVERDDLAEVEDSELCHAFSRYQENERLRDEIKSRELLTDRDWQVVDNPDADIGTAMTEMGVICTQGKPNSVNVVGTPDGEREQWTYGTLGSRVYIFFDEGEVTFWQE